MQTVGYVGHYHISVDEVGWRWTEEDGQAIEAAECDLVSIQEGSTPPSGLPRIPCVVIIPILYGVEEDEGAEGGGAVPTMSCGD